MIRRLMLPLILIGCFGVPYLATHKGLGEKFQGAVSSFRGGSQPGGATPVALPQEMPTSYDEQGQPVTQVSNVPTLAGPPVVEFGEIFRFDINPNWVLSRWTRVSTAPTASGLELEGFRVPVVTGVNPDDLAGSLTYYFDREQQLQRLHFQGTTGDPSKLIAFVQQYYELQYEESLDAALYMKKWNGKPYSVLRVRRSTVVLADNTRNRFEVLLELNRPDRGAKLSDQVMQELEADKRGSRW